LNYHTGENSVALDKGNRRYAKWPSLERSHSRRRSPVVGTPYAPPSARPCGCRGVVASIRRCALCCWSVACGQSCGVCPRPPLCFAAARHQPCALVCPSAPHGGSLSPRHAGQQRPASRCAIKCIAACAHSPGATGRSGLQASVPLACIDELKGKPGACLETHYGFKCIIRHELGHPISRPLCHRV
jgi:hypothetical protein